MAGPRMDEGDGSLGAPPRRAVDQLQAVDLEPEEGLCETGDLEADVVEALALRGKEPGDARRVVGRLHELDLRLADAEERDPDAVVGDVHDGLELEAQEVAPDRQALVDRADDQGHVVDLAQAPDPGRSARAR